MIGEAYSFFSLKDMLHHKSFNQYTEEYLSVLHTLKEHLASLLAEGMQYYDIMPDRIFVGNSRLVILADGKEKYQFARSFSSKMIVPDMKYCPPELCFGKISDSSTADIYNFSALCYYIITSTTDIKTGLPNAKGARLQKKKLINAVKTHNIPIDLSESIMAGMTANPVERSKDYLNYAVLDKYSYLPAESLFFKPDTQIGHQKEKIKKVPHFKIIIAALSVFILFAIFCSLINSKKTETKRNTPLPASTKKCIPSSVPTKGATSVPTQTPTPIVTASPVPTVCQTAIPTISLTKKPEITIKPTAKPTKRPIHTKKPTFRPKPRVTVKPIVRPTRKPEVKIRPTRKPMPIPTKRIKEEEIEGIN